MSLGDCEWAPFAEWAPCSKSCGTGEQTRARIQLQTALNGGLACAGLGTIERECNTQLCPGK
jgi:complement component 6